MSAPNPDCPGCQALLAQVNQLTAQVAQLQEQVAQLATRLNRNSKNSSRPPSADPPDAPSPSPKPTPAGRKHGGQPGHPGVTHRLKPTQACHHVVPFFPPACAHCHTPLPQEPASDAPRPRRQQVLELPQTLIETIEYQCHAARCPHCHALTWATPDPPVPPGLLGPRLQALCALLVGRHRVSRRGLQEFLLEAGGEAVALGTLVELEARTTSALQAPYEQARSVLWQAAVVYVDETPWREGKHKAWLWSASTLETVLFRIDRRRSRAAFELLLPPRADGSRRTVVCDRYSAYQHLQGDERGVCWSHLRREFVALSELTGLAQALGEALLAATGWLFEGWHAFRAGELDRAGLQRWMRPVMAQFGELLGLAQRSGHWRAAPLGRELLKQWECLWTFVRVAGVEPTNNTAERAVRPGVLWRKCSFGNQGAGGRAFVERMLTVVGSLRRQGRGVLKYLEEAIQAAQQGVEPPSLLAEASG